MHRPQGLKRELSSGLIEIVHAPAPDNPDKRVLPAGWSEHYDTDKKLWVYVQNDVFPPKVTSVHPLGGLNAAPDPAAPVTQGLNAANSNPKDPRPLPSGWISHYDTQTNAWLYTRTDVFPPVVSKVHPLGPVTSSLASAEPEHDSRRPAGKPFSMSSLPVQLVSPPGLPRRSTTGNSSVVHNHHALYSNAMARQSSYNADKFLSSETPTSQSPLTRQHAVPQPRKKVSHVTTVARPPPSYRSPLMSQNSTGSLSYPTLSNGTSAPALHSSSLPPAPNRPQSIYAPTPVPAHRPNTQSLIHPTSPVSSNASHSTYSSVHGGSGQNNPQQQHLSYGQSVPQQQQQQQQPTSPGYSQNVTQQSPPPAAAYDQNTSQQPQQPYAGYDQNAAQQQQSMGYDQQQQPAPTDYGQNTWQQPEQAPVDNDWQQQPPDGQQPQAAQQQQQPTALELELQQVQDMISGMQLASSYLNPQQQQQLPASQQTPYVATDAPYQYNFLEYTPSSDLPVQGAISNFALVGQPEQTTPYSFDLSATFSGGGEAGAESSGLGEYMRLGMDFVNNTLANAGGDSADPTATATSVTEAVSQDSTGVLAGVASGATNFISGMLQS